MDSYEQLKRKIETSPTILVYLSAPGFGVCHADWPRVQALADYAGIHVEYVDISLMPEAAQLMVFTAPAVLLYHRGREYHRQAGIIDFNQLKKRMEECLERDLEEKIL